MSIFVYLSEGGGGGGGEDGDSFNSVTCFCGKPFAGRPMIECSSCLTWLHMSCAKVKRKNIPEFYYCDNCKNNGLLSPTNNLLGTSTASSGEEATTPTLVRNSQNGTLSSNNNIIDGLFMANQNQNLSTASTKPRKPKMIKKNSSTSLMMSSSDNIKNNTTSDSKYLTNKKSSPSSVNGKLKKIRKLSPTTKKMRQTSPKTTKSYASSSLAAAASLTELSLNHQVTTITNIMQHPNGVTSENASSNIKSPIATNNNIYSNAIETQNIADTENGDTEKFNKRLKLL